MAIDIASRRPLLGNITGPSTTADIESTLFKGMHGPKKIHVILVG